MYTPSWFNMSATSSLPITPSLSRSRIWNPSRNSRTWTGCNFDNELISPAGRGAASVDAAVPDFSSAFAPRVGDDGGWRRAGVRPRGVHESETSVMDSVIGVLPWFSFDDVEVKCAIWGGLVGEVVGVVELRKGEGEAGDSGRRNGEARGEP